MLVLSATFQLQSTLSDLINGHWHLVGKVLGTLLNYEGTPV